MNISVEVDLGQSLRQIFGKERDANAHIEHDCARQTETVKAILDRFFSRDSATRREMMILADEVGLGKTYVVLAVAVTLLDAIRRGEAPEGIPTSRPAVLVLTPGNSALFNKWQREASSFQGDCARPAGSLDWLRIAGPIDHNERSGNIVDLTTRLRSVKRDRPLLLVAKKGALGAAIDDRDMWRRRGLAIIFDRFRISPDDRRWWCRKVLGSGSVQEVPELLDLRKSGNLWDVDKDISNDIKSAYAIVLRDEEVHARIKKAITEPKDAQLTTLLDDLTRRALVRGWPTLPLVIIDEIHNLKNEEVQARQHLENLLSGRMCRLLGLSATPFQLCHEELESILGIRKLLSLPKDRAVALDAHVASLSDAMRESRKVGEVFRHRWKMLRRNDEITVSQAWHDLIHTSDKDRRARVKLIAPRRVGNALDAAFDLQQANQALRKHLSPFVIRHQHSRGYRENFVGSRAEAAAGGGTPHFAWHPGMDVSGDAELAHYLMMRAVKLAEDERGLPGLGAELTGSYRHLVETATVWKRLEKSKNPQLREYHALLGQMIGSRSNERDPDAEHRKIQATVKRALEFFRRGQKSLIFCVFTKTAEAVRDRIQKAIDEYLEGQCKLVFDSPHQFENFRRRFFNRREPLFSLIQDHPLLGRLAESQEIGLDPRLALPVAALDEVARVLLANGELPDNPKPDRRLVLAATEHTAIRHWQSLGIGDDWLKRVAKNDEELRERMRDAKWLQAREPLTRGDRTRTSDRTLDPEGRSTSVDPSEIENHDDAPSDARMTTADQALAPKWVRRLREDAIGDVIGWYFQPGVIRAKGNRPPLLIQHHWELLREFDLATRAVAGQVFRRVLMADEFLLRYLTDVERDNATQWADYLGDRYMKRLEGHGESLRDRVHAYLETLARAKSNKMLLEGYYSAAENRNVVQLVKGGMDRDRYFLGFNTPYRPEILVATQVGQEGIDLHRECRHVIHHDLCWNPATIEQRTGRVDRIGSKVERERLSAEVVGGPTLEIAVPYLAATYDERMFEELYRRAQLFEVTLGGEMRIDGRLNVESEKSRRMKEGIGTEDENLGDDSADTGVVDLPGDMVERLRVDLAVWKQQAGSRR